MRDAGAVLRIRASALGLEGSSMGCLLVMFGAAFPRLAVVLVWIARPALVAQVFGDFLLLPLLGIIFLPFTTLLYLVLWSPGGLSGFDYVILVAAVILDASHLGASAYTNREAVRWRDR
jgi:hypothetical protein